jgi:hypothetical protein
VKGNVTMEILAIRSPERARLDQVCVLQLTQPQNAPLPNIAILRMLCVKLYATLIVIVKMLQNAKN